MYRIEIYPNRKTEKPTCVFTDPVKAVFALSGWRDEYAQASPVELPDLAPHEIQGYVAKLHTEAGHPSGEPPVVDWWYEILLSVANTKDEYQPIEAAELINSSLEIKALCANSGIRLLTIRGESDQPDAMLMLAKNEEALWNVFKEAQKIIDSKDKQLIVASTREAMNFKGGSSTMWARSIYERSYASWINSH